LRALGVRRGAVVHGGSGLDEVSGDAPSQVYSFDERGVRTWRLEPRDAGIAAPLRTPVGGSIERCRDAFVEILQGTPGDAADVVALNAALVLQVAGARDGLADAFEMARGVLRSGAAWQTFEKAREAAARG
jgi:anthranilate phosphoribosyltransferase